MIILRSWGKTLHVPRTSRYHSQTTVGDLKLVRQQLILTQMPPLRPEMLPCEGAISREFASFLLESDPFQAVPQSA